MYYRHLQIIRQARDNECFCLYYDKENTKMHLLIRNSCDKVLIVNIAYIALIGKIMSSLLKETVGHRLKADLKSASFGSPVSIRSISDGVRPLYRSKCAERRIWVVPRARLVPCRDGLFFYENIRQSMLRKAHVRLCGGIIFNERNAAKTAR